MKSKQLTNFAKAILGTMCATTAAFAAIPEDFPSFHVPGKEEQMHNLRSLFWNHYENSGPACTLWDEWLSAPTLWPASSRSAGIRDAWRNVLSGRILDEDGYVATHQHASIAHQLGWPFPFWNQGRRGFGHHFSFKDTVGPEWRPRDLSTTEGWELADVEDAGLGEEGWNLKLTGPNAALTAPAKTVDTFEAPFLQLRWSCSGVGDLKPSIQWATAEAPEFSPGRSVSFEAGETSGIVYTMIPMYEHPLWKGKTEKLRIALGNSGAGEVTLQAFFSQYDTRHNINSQSFVLGCANYFWWTGDVEFLRSNINRMRMAMRHLMTEHNALEEKVIHTKWIGHDGRSGLELLPDGTKIIHHGRGVGNNYWDLLPFGGRDVYATIRYYEALNCLARLEAEIDEHPEWNIPSDSKRMRASELLAHAAEVKRKGNELFWNRETGRFAPINNDGQMQDYGLTFLNLEAIHYDFATREHADKIMKWIAGERAVSGDTSQTTDIYHWRFAPRATTKRNIEYYLWAWSAPEDIPWGGQVQDGGAVLGFSYHDLMARLKTRGADDAWQRLNEVLAWFEEVQRAGGYRKYYDGSREGTLQGGGTAGGLGLDREFVESIMIAQVMIDGFLGFVPDADGFKLTPRLAAECPELEIRKIRFRDVTLNARVSRDSIQLEKEAVPAQPIHVRVRADQWKIDAADEKDMTNGTNRTNAENEIKDGWLNVIWGHSPVLRFSSSLRTE